MLFTEQGDQYMKNQINYEFSIDIEQLEEMDEEEELWLSPREIELWKIHAGHTLSECAELMNIKYGTAERHRDNIYRKRMRAKHTIAWMEWIQNQGETDDGLDEFDSDSNGGDDARDDL